MLQGSREDGGWEALYPLSIFSVLQTSMISMVSFVVHEKLKWRLGESETACRNHTLAQAQGTPKLGRHVRIIWFCIETFPLDPSSTEQSAIRHLGIWNGLGSPAVAPPLRGQRRTNGVGIRLTCILFPSEMK